MLVWTRVDADGNVIDGWERYQSAPDQVQIDDQDPRVLAYFQSIEQAVAQAAADKASLLAALQAGTATPDQVQAALATLLGGGLAAGLQVAGPDGSASVPASPG